MQHVALALMATILLVVTVMLGGCTKEPVLPLDLPLPKPDLMVHPDKTPLPALSEKQPARVKTLFANAAEVRGQCVSDRKRLADLQTYVVKLTGKKQ